MPRPDAIAGALDLRLTVAQRFDADGADLGTRHVAAFTFATDLFEAATVRGVRAAVRAGS